MSDNLDRFVGVLAFWMVLVLWSIFLTSVVSSGVAVRIDGQPHRIQFGWGK